MILRSAVNSPKPVGTFSALCRFTLLIVVGAASLLVVAPSDSIAQAAAVTALYAQKPCTPVYASSDIHSTLLTQLLPGTEVKSLGQATVGAQQWTHVSIWSGIEGYIPSNVLSVSFPAGVSDNGCSYPGLPIAEANPLTTQHGPFPLIGHAAVTIPASVYASPDTRSMPLASLTPGAELAFSAWATDAKGSPWYKVSITQGNGWIWGGDIRMDMPNPATESVNGKPIWTPMAGKGMYATNYLVHHSDVNALVQAAKKAGITHLYTEVAITRYGFYAQDSLNRLLPVAHQAGLTVIAWIYTNLDNIGDDARMTEIVANYRTPTGDRADGLLMDIEEVTDSASVYTYGQLARAMLGPDVLFVASVFHPYARPGYPYAAIAASFNVIAPMDYWHSRKNRAYSDEVVQRFVSVS
ncbi:MAG TPA: hypothetical protein VJR48_18160, partial [Ktedonobacterales bacterium]|nr:hypothetical protein [Ktedonobacterales bacterium]